MTMRLTFTLISAVISSFKRVRRTDERDPKPWHPEEETLVSERLMFRPRLVPVV